MGAVLHSLLARSLSRVGCDLAITAPAERIFELMEEVKRVFRGIRSVARAIERLLL